MLPLAASLAEAVLAVGKQVQPSGKFVTDASAIGHTLQRLWSTPQGGSFHLPHLLTTLLTFPLTVRRDLLSSSHALRQTVDYVLASLRLRMRGPDEAEKLLLFQRCLPALMECRMYLSTAPTRLSCDEEQAFARLRKGDVDLAYGFSSVMGKASLCRVCPAMRSRPRSLAGQWS